MARLFNWGAAHEIYLPEIDAEHRAIFEAGQQVQQAIESGASPEQIKPLLEALMSCAEDHFRHEERLMQEARYSGFEWHKGQHDGVRRRMRHFVAALENGQADAPQLLLEYLAEWLDDHTALTDRMMGATLRNHDRELHRRSALRGRPAGTHEVVSRTL
jgi:hemerythrin